MQIKVIVILFLLAVFFLPSVANQDAYLDVFAQVSPSVIRQGQEGVLKIKIIPRASLRISANPELMIRFDNNSNLVYPKQFFTGSELNFKTVQEQDGIYLDFDREIEITFKVSEAALLGRQVISGEIVYTALFQDNWSIKTYQRFSTNFTSLRNTSLPRK